MDQSLYAIFFVTGDLPDVAQFVVRGLEGFGRDGHMRILVLGFGGKLGVRVSIALDSEIHPGKRDHQAGAFVAAAFWAGIGEQIFHRLLKADSEIGHGLDLRGGQVVVGVILRGDRDGHMRISVFGFWWVTGWED
jgi:hypothetical protein